MGTRNATRAQLLIALRRWMPNTSVRRLGDLVDAATLMTVSSKEEMSASLAFGFVLDGTLRVTMEGAPPRFVGPGELFGMSQYELHGDDRYVAMTGTAKITHYLAFAHATVKTVALAARGYRAET